MKKYPILLLGGLMTGLLAGCGDASNTSNVSAPDPVAQPEIQLALFQRTCDRVKGLIATKEFRKAREALAVFKDQKLAAEQQKLVDQLKAQIPAEN